MALKSPVKTDSTWALLFLFTVSNALLSYGSFPLWLKAVILMAGILLPLGLALRKGPPSSPGTGVPLLSQDFLPAIPPWILLCLVGAALFIRFYRLTSLFVWPGLDESLLEMFAIRLSENWDWKFFYTFGQVPPLPIWASALLLKSGASPFFSLWFPSGVVSTLTVLALYAAARQFFSRSFALVCCGLWAFGYWPFLLGRICHQGVWLPLWAFLCLYFLGRFQKAPSEEDKKWKILTVGFAVGLGSFTFTPWPFFGLAILWALFGPSLSSPPRNIRYFPFFAAGALPALGPFLWAVWREGYGQHISAMSAFSGWFSLQHQVLTVLSYFTEILWGTLEDDSAYVASYGGMLNPLWAAFFCLGLIQMVRFRFLPLVQWSLWAFFLALLPGLLSMNVETFRVALALPFIYLVTALGMAELLSTLSPSRRGVFFLALLVLGTAIDGYRVVRSHINPLDQPGVPVAGSFPIANLKAYQILQEVRGSLGPGLIFTEFTETPYDQSLFDSTYSFNAAENKSGAAEARWAGLVTNAGYYPFLSPRFPGSVWYRLGSNQPGEPPMLLGTIPVNEKTLKSLDRWVEVHHYFRDLSWKINSISEDRTYRAADLLFLQRPPGVAEDPFLESSYWDRRAEFYYNYDFKNHFEDQLNALRQAVLKGYPSADLYYKIGSLLTRRGRYDEARLAFEKALRVEPENREVLDALSLEKDLENKAAPAK
jgi:4-amino-4-deoxy-L-arabinose transferase-like glycosyltransferase